MGEYRNYYNDEREIEWEKFDDEIADLSLQLIETRFDDTDQIPEGLRFGGAYVFKIVDGESNRQYLEGSEESAAVLEYDKADPQYDEEFVEKFAETFSASKEERREKIEENFNVLLK